MPQLPSEFSTVILPYARRFCKRVFAPVQLLTIGAILAPGKPTVTAIVRIVGLQQEPAFHNYYRVLSHGRWPARKADQILLQQLLTRFIAQQPLIIGIGETASADRLERRWGPKIHAIGTYHDAVRSSDSNSDKCSGLPHRADRMDERNGADQNTLG